jgi:uncharacterized sulfatase
MPELISARARLWLPSLAFPSVDAQRAKRMNVLFIAVDDLNTQLHCYGNALVQSPNIDRLARRGVLFRQAYCQYPLCNPSRTSLLSGRRPETTRIFDNNTPPRTYLKDVVFLPEYFRQHGYFTARVGKIAHGRFEDAVTWDVSENPRGGGGGAKARAAAPAKGEGAMKLSYLATGNQDADEPDGRTARRVARLLEQNRDKPFFLGAGFHKPHLPFVAPKKYFDLYPPDKITLPENPPAHRAGIPPVALTRTKGDDELSDAEKRQVIAGYHAATSFMDAQVGVLLDALDRLKLSENTVVLLFGDNGFHLNEHGLWRKMTLFEEAAGVPLIIAVPGKRAGAVCQRVAEFIDIYPTLAELCGLPAPQGMEGVSMTPLLDDPNRAWKKAAFTMVARGRGIFGHSLRTERYRYTEWSDEKTAELYDQQTDPHEYKNLATDPRHAATLAEMRRLMRAGWRGALPGSHL